MIFVMMMFVGSKKFQRYSMCRKSCFRVYSSTTTNEYYNYKIW